MYRTRSYRRDMRNRKIARKKRIDKAVHCSIGPWYDCDGKYSKGKIHCSCKMCTYSKIFDLATVHDLKNREFVKSQFEDIA